MTTGKCLCGEVRFSLQSAPQQLGLCHCGMCRAWCGGMPLAAFQAEVTLQKSETLRWWRGSPWSERGFCAQCGTSLFWRAEGSPQWGVAAGAVDSGAAMEIGLHIFTDDKADFYEITDGAPQKTGAQFTAETLSQLAAQIGEGFLPAALKQSRDYHGDAFADEVEAIISRGSERTGA